LQNDDIMSVPVEQLRDLRRDSTMQTARLEHAILQTVINHVSEEHLTREQIVMALINVAGYWTKKIILDTLINTRTKELNGDPDA
jgi:Glu-tRNA(Gln) amidotransferase subunit E-like FAD-binding protein